MNQVTFEFNKWFRTTNDHSVNPGGMSRKTYSLYHVLCSSVATNCKTKSNCNLVVSISLFSLYDYFYRWNDCSVLYLPHWTGCLLESQSPSSNKMLILNPQNLWWIRDDHIYADTWCIKLSLRKRCQTWLLTSCILCLYQKGTRDARFSLSVDIGLEPWRFAPCRMGRWWGD